MTAKTKNLPPPAPLNPLLESSDLQTMEADYRASRRQPLRKTFEEWIRCRILAARMDKSNVWQRARLASLYTMAATRGRLGYFESVMVWCDEQERDGEADSE